MFDTLSEKLQRIFKNLKGEGRITEEHLDVTLKEIRIALLEADVNFKVVKQFTDAVKQKSLGQEVMQSLSPGQQIVKIVHAELIEILGGENVRLNFTSQPPTVVMMVGLQGSGKTTSTGKLAKWLTKNNHRPMLVSVDVYRPAAREQLKVIAKDIEVKIWDGAAGDKPLALCEGALREARNTGHDVLLIDTAGRLHIDEELMKELTEIKDKIRPHEILFVADAMLGQDAVKSAQQFHEKLGFNGFILTKMDGDARGGAALSIKQVTGQPVKFVGTGEKYDALEVFHPDRLASRIIGMGDVLSLIEKAQEVVDQKQALETLRKDNFTLEDFRDQLRQIKKLGSMEQILSMLPSVGPFKEMQKAKVDEKELVRTEAIIDSMTPKERRNHQIINGSRRKRIAKGSGTSVQEVNQLLKQYVQAQKMMKTMKSSFFGKRMKGLKMPF
ncbi:MAG TPA: signal recognition particle protein [Terriglobia bacterium]|nr:signal recognition particle protein [Terriglobia bacterium]